MALEEAKAKFAREHSQAREVRKSKKVRLRLYDPKEKGGDRQEEGLYQNQGVVTGDLESQTRRRPTETEDLAKGSYREEVGLGIPDQDCPVID